MSIAPRFAPQLFALFMSCFMAFIMTAFITWVNTGMGDGYVARWLYSFVFAWPLAMACILLFANRVRGFVAKLTAP